jgi:membrane protease subunit HflK
MNQPTLSSNEPDWGRGDKDQGTNGSRKPQGDGPPDLEEAWRDFNKKLSGMFGKTSSGGAQRPSGDSGAPFSGKGAGYGAGLVAALALLLWLATGLYIVPEGQQAVVLKFGKLDGVVSTAGPSYRLPYPIGAHELVNVQSVRSVEIGYRGNSRSKIPQEALMLTDDENIIDIQFAVQYRIREDGAASFVFENKNPEDTVKLAAETSMRAVIGGKTMDSILESRAEVALAVQKTMQEILDRYKTGVLVTSVSIQNAQPPEQVQAAFEDANRAQQDRERQINEGKAYANDVIPKASGTAARLLQEADGYKRRVIESATGDASRFKAILTEYNKAPGVTRDRMYIETMQQIYQNTTKVMVDTKSASPLLYMPLDQLLKQSSDPAARPTAAVPATLPATPSVTPPSVDNDRRDGLRNRDQR